MINNEFSLIINNLNYYFKNVEKMVQQANIILIVKK